MLEFEKIWRRSWDDAEPEEEEKEEVEVLLFIIMLLCICKQNKCYKYVFLLCPNYA